MFDIFHQLLDLDTFELYHLNYQRPQSICQTYTVLFICRSVWNKLLVSRRNGLTPGRHYEGLKVSEPPPKKWFHIRTLRSGPYWKKQRCLFMYFHHVYSLSENKSASYFTSRTLCHGQLRILPPCFIDCCIREPAAN